MGVEGRMKVVIDTCVLRDVVERSEIASKAEVLIQLAPAFHFAIFEASLLELLRQLLEEEIPWSAWTKARATVQGIIDPDVPVFIALDDPTWTAAPPEKDRAAKRTAFREIYEIMMRTERHNALKKKVKKADLEAQMKTSARKFTAIIRSMEADLRGLVHRERKRAIQASSAANDPAWWLAVMELVKLATLTRDGYKPEKRPQDDPDLKLLVALSLPAYILTSDGPLIRRVQQTQSKEAERIMTLDEFIAFAGATES